MLSSLYPPASKAGKLPPPQIPREENPKTRWSDTMQRKSNQRGSHRGAGIAAESYSGMQAYEVLPELETTLWKVLPSPGRDEVEQLGTGGLRPDCFLR